MNSQTDWNKFIKAIGRIVIEHGKIFDQVKQDHWWQMLEGFAIEEVEHSIIKCLKNSPYEPKTADVIKNIGPDYDECFDRMIARKPHRNDIEAITSSSVGYMCRTQLSDTHARLRYKKEYIRQAELSKQPRQPVTHRIEEQRQPDIKDQMVEAGLHKFKGKTFEEISLMRKNLEQKTKLKR